MIVSKKPVTRRNANGTKASLEESLWAAADKIRGHVDASDYKHIVLGLIFLKYLSDVSYEHAYEKHNLQLPDVISQTPRTETTFHIPENATWWYLKSHIGERYLAKIIDDAMIAIEDANSSLRGTLPKNYERFSQHSYLLSELISLINSIELDTSSNNAKDILGRIYEYFLGRFASVGGRGGEFYTPASVVKLLVEMIEPYAGSVYDPCCGTGGMFVQSEKFVLAHGGKREDISIYGQELNPTTWQLCKMNLIMRGIDGNIGEYPADTFHNDIHPSHKADFILANPPFNVSDWGGERLRGDYRWRYGTPANGNANFAWVQHIIHHLASSGVAAFVLTNGSLSGGQESSIRQALLKADLVDCIVALPPNLFYNTQIASCIWIVAKNKQDILFRSRQGSTLFIYAQQRGQMIDRVHRELSEEDINAIVQAYHRWRSKDKDSHTAYRDEPGFCKSATLNEIHSHEWSLVPGRYVGFDRSTLEQWDSEHLRMELEQVERRLTEISHSSISALSVLKELTYG